MTKPGTVFRWKETDTLTAAFKSKSDYVKKSPRFFLDKACSDRLMLLEAIEPSLFCMLSHSGRVWFLYSSDLVPCDEEESITK